MRIGHGYDVHRLVPGRRCVLCGVEVPSEVGLLGHSDADAATHALMDALLGAAALGDIGRLFPDTDDAFLDISSLVLLDQVVERVRDRGFVVGNADITIVAQKPRLSAYIGEMVRTLAEHLHVAPDRVNVKATTEEGLGFTGNATGIAAHAVVLLEDAPRTGKRFAVPL